MRTGPSLEREPADRVDHPRIERGERLGAGLSECGRMWNCPSRPKPRISAQASLTGEVGHQEHDDDVDDAAEQEAAENEEQRPPHAHCARG